MYYIDIRNRKQTNLIKKEYKMKTLAECKEYFKDVYTTWLIYQDDDTYKALGNLEQTLSFIYPEFKNVMNTWINEASKEYYENLKTA